MAKQLKQFWEGNPQALSRRDRMSGTYMAYLPDKLVGRAFSFSAQVAADLADAESAIGSLDHRSSPLADTEALARILLRAESVASSRIENLHVGARRLLRAEAARDAGLVTPDVNALEILNNIAAMARAVQFAPKQTLKPKTILEIHARLLAGTRLDNHGGKIREEQNWIGGSTPCGASFVPPPPGALKGLLEDLCAFCNTDDLPATAQAAIAHAQFETMHPFVDGNGRTGRALIYLILRRRGLALRVLPPVSLILATHAKAYVDGLTATRYLGPASGKAARDGTDVWVGTFAGACVRAVADVNAFAGQARQIETGWRQKLIRVRAHSTVDLLLGKLVGAPVLTVKAAAALTGRSLQQTNEAVSRLTELGILKQISVGQRNRAFEAPDIVAAFTGLERRLGSATGDTQVAKPQRPVPARVVK